VIEESRLTPFNRPLVENESVSVPESDRLLGRVTAGYRQRNRVKRFSSGSKPFRRIATRYEKYARTFLGMVPFTAALLDAR